jgi:hypothetical protein
MQKRILAICKFTQPCSRKEIKNDIAYCIKPALECRFAQKKGRKNENVKS